jgi:N-acetylglutamate synthase-like GNAT family acetyltransferase
MEFIPAVSCGDSSATVDGEFSERSFFLKAFQGRYLTFVLSDASDLVPESVDALRRLLMELLVEPHRNGREGSRILLLYEATEEVSLALSPIFSCFAQQLQIIVPDAAQGMIPPLLWQHPGEWCGKRLLAMAVPVCHGVPFADQILQFGLHLRMSRLIWLDREGGINNEAGQVQGYFNSARLTELLRSREVPRLALLQRLQRLLAGGVKAIVLCRVGDLEQELFTYQGCGSFFSRHPYCRVRRLGLDDYAEAVTIIRRGEQEGFLLPRSPVMLSQVLAGSVGAYILEDRLAGLCALHSTAYQAEKAGEVVSLYTLTRYQGVGVGGQLLAHLVQEARQQGLHTLFACTRHERVAEFFLRCRLGRHRDAFYRVDAPMLPAAKWQGYDPLRKREMICLRLQLGE